jgi:hypothetical protein
MTKEKLNKLNMPELWKACKKFGIKRGKHDTKEQLINKIVNDVGLSGDSKPEQTTNQSNLEGSKKYNRSTYIDSKLNGENSNISNGKKTTITLSGYDFLDILLKQDNINLRKLYKKRVTLERRKHKGKYNVFFITGNRTLAKNVIGKPEKTEKDYKITSRKKISEGFLFFPDEYRSYSYYKIPLQDLKDAEIKKIIDFLNK